MWLDFICQERNLLSFSSSPPLLSQVSCLVSFSTKLLSETLDKHQAPSPETVALIFDEFPEGKASSKKEVFTGDSALLLQGEDGIGIFCTGLSSWPWTPWVTMERTVGSLHSWKVKLPPDTGTGRDPSQCLRVGILQELPESSQTWDRSLARAHGDSRNYRRSSVRGTGQGDLLGQGISDIARGGLQEWGEKIETWSTLENRSKWKFLLEKLDVGGSGPVHISQIPGKSSLLPCFNWKVALALNSHHSWK